MDLNHFVKNFASQFQETAIESFNSNTRYREEIDEWDSLTALAIIAMVDSNYNVVIKGEDIRNTQTIEDLFKIVKSRY